MLFRPLAVCLVLFRPWQFAFYVDLPKDGYPNYVCLSNRWFTYYVCSPNQHKVIANLIRCQLTYVLQG